MNDYLLTPHNFDTGGLRESLRVQHGFEHPDLERAKWIIGDAIKHVERTTGASGGMGARHFDTALEFLNKDHAGWKELPGNQRTHIETALKEHFGIARPDRGAA
ncbi:MAG: hypothetical protein KGH56_01390 [Patescibacteria group bacterium]|nr:hypothetical protein [Patescibacteria group bacterium]